MKRMTKNIYKGLVKKTFSIISRAIENKQGIGKTEKELRKFVNSVPGATKKERFALYNVAMRTFRSSRASYDWQKQLSKRETYDSVLRVCRRIQSKVMLREKKRAHRANMDSDEYIFYLCSEHNNPAKDHKEWQGKIYVDRFWRTKVESSLAVPVLDYIKKNGILTVQEIMGEPVYMTTRPYCRHYFIPVKTVTVLTRSNKNIVLDYRAKKREKLYSADEYYQVRSEVYRDMNNVSPCYYFEKKMKRR